MINLLFDTFQNTKYFHAHIYAISYPFCVGSFAYSIHINFFMVD
jgi:hypothetical protein